MPGTAAASPPVQAAPALDTETLSSRLARLRELLEDDDTEAAELLEDLVAQPALQRHRSELEQLSAWIDEFDFEQALDTLDSLTRTIEAPS